MEQKYRNITDPTRIYFISRIVAVIITVSFFVLSFSNSAAAQSVDFKIKGVGIGTSYQMVLGRLGEPLTNTKSGTNPCGGKRRMIHYSGLTIKFDEDESKQNIVIFIEVTSPKWEISPGISVGSSLRTVRTKFGRPNELLKRSGFDTVTYLDGDGAVTFYFRNKKLVKATRDLNLC